MIGTAMASNRSRSRSEDRDGDDHGLFLTDV